MYVTRIVFLFPSISKTLRPILYVFLPLFYLHSLFPTHGAISFLLPALFSPSRRVDAGEGTGGEVLTTSCVYVCMVWPHRQLPALAGGEQATSRQNELPSPTQLSERSRELRPHRPRYLRRSARTPKLQQCTLDARRFVGDPGEGVGRTTLRTWEVEETAFRQCQAPSTLEIPPAVHHSLT